MITVYVSKQAITDIAEARKFLSVAKSKLRDRSPVHREAQNYMAERWDQNFSTEGGIYQSWPELAEWTIQERGSAHPILVRKGDLYAHFSDQNSNAEITEESTQWDFQNMEGAWTVSHHTGYPNPIGGRRPIPARVLWDINKADEAEIQQMFEIWLEGVFGGAD